MPKLKKSIDVNVPVRVAYDQWTQFEDFPRFMEGVESVEQQDDKRLHWRARTRRGSSSSSIGSPRVSSSVSETCSARTTSASRAT